MGQVTNESHGVRQRHRAPGFGQIQLARCGVERGEQLVGRIRSRLDQGIEQRRLTGIGVADQGDVEGIAARALAALRLALTFDAFQALLGALDTLADHAAIELDLGFAGSAAHADTAALALQVRPPAHQPGAEVLQAREFDLQLALVTARTLAKNLQNQERTVIDRALQVTLEVALLRRADALIKQDLGGTQLGGKRFDLIGLATANKKRWVRCAPFAGDAPDHCQTSGLRQQPKLLELLVEIR